MTSGIGMQKYGAGVYAAALAGCYRVLVLGAVSALLPLVRLRCEGLAYDYSAC